MSYKRYYLSPAAWAPKGRLVAYEKYSQIIPTQKIETEVIETQAVDDLQDKLDEAKDYIERLIYSYYNPHAMDFDAVVLNAEKFLREVENEST